MYEDRVASRSTINIALYEESRKVGPDVSRPVGCSYLRVFLCVFLFVKIVVLNLSHNFMGRISSLLIHMQQLTSSWEIRCIQPISRTFKRGGEWVTCMQIPWDMYVWMAFSRHLTISCLKSHQNGLKQAAYSATYSSYPCPRCCPSLPNDSSAAQQVLEMPRKHSGSRS